MTYISMIGIPPQQQGNMYQFQINGMIRAYIDFVSKTRGAL